MAYFCGSCKEYLFPLIIFILDTILQLLRPNGFVYFFFLKIGIDVDVQLKSGWTPLMLAASLALPDMVELLANKGANVNFQKGNNSSVGESFLVNPLHSNIGIHILHTVLYTFPKVLTRRIC